MCSMLYGIYNYYGLFLNSIRGYGHFLVVLGLIVFVLLNIYGMTPILVHWYHPLVIGVTTPNNVFSGTYYF